MYTSRAHIDSLGLVPARLPWDDADAKITAWITQASREIDAGVGPAFPVTDTDYKFDPYPDTPVVVALIAAWVTASYTYQALGVVSRDDGPPIWARYRDMAEKKLSDIRAGRIDVIGDGEEKDTGTPTPIVTATRPPVTVGGWSLRNY